MEQKAKVLFSTFKARKRAKTCSKAFLLFARLMCASRIFNKRKHVLAKALLPKAALLDWSAPGLRHVPGKVRPHPSPGIIGHHHKRSFHTGANDLRCRRALKPKYINTELFFNKFGVHEMLPFSVQPLR